jgi:hypothetical protein
MGDNVNTIAEFEAFKKASADNVYESEDKAVHAFDGADVGGFYSEGALSLNFIGNICRDFCDHGGAYTLNANIRTNSQATTAHGNEESAESNAANSNTTGSLPPTEAYDREYHYGKTPTQADRKALGATPDQDVEHNIPLVKHYHEGTGEPDAKPGHLMTDEERKAFANDRKNMSLLDKSKNRSEGATKHRAYSMQKNKQYNLKKPVGVKKTDANKNKS